MIKSFRISLTDSCNYNCLFCHGEGLIKNKNFNDKITLERIKKLMQVIKKLNVNKITLTGGEPFLNPNILNIVKIIKDVQLNTYLSISSNISSPKNEDLLEVSKYIDKINVNFQSCDEKIFNKITNTNFFNEVKEKLNFLSKNNKNLKISLNFVYTQYNYENLIEVIKFADKNNFDLKVLELVKNKETNTIYQDIRNVKDVISNFINTTGKNIKEHKFIGKSDERYIFENFTIRLIYAYCNGCKIEACCEHGEIRVILSFELKSCLLSDKYNISILEDLDNDNIELAKEKILKVNELFVSQNVTLASVSIIKYENSLLMVERTHKDGKITLETPGGHIEEGETPE